MRLTVSMSLVRERFQTAPLLNCSIARNRLVYGMKSAWTTPRVICNAVRSWSAIM